MPISIDKFDHYEAPNRHETNAEQVIRFLVENRDQAFKATEIADETGINRNSIQPVLNRLRSRELVRHKEPYWAIGDLDRVRDAFMFQSTTQFLDEKLGQEDRDEWLDAAAESNEDDE
ncbi:HTH domain-containing protein [Halomontanus rarus]|uniref:HTH domain-containing protein n=1 Tax=Halomontanus rarus TaxID=3034020 RepID=UPI0023E8257F|nr:MULTISPECIES: HTH domain-containing protein [unclassified Halovivax]